MSLSHLPPSERLATLKRCAQTQGQTPWWYCSPDDLLWVIEEYEAAQARTAELEKQNAMLTQNVRILAAQVFNNVLSDTVFEAHEYDEDQL